MNEPAATAALEAVVRDSYSQLLAFVAARAGGDVAAAEDALGEALLAALRQWPAEGVPERPPAWLLAAARRRLLDHQRRGDVRMRAQPELLRAFAEAQGVVDAGHDFPDERLPLLLVCAHPAIEAAARTPLMLQAVLGLDAARIAAAFLTSSAAMGQRLVRAKAKIRAAGIPFAVPPPEEWPPRLAAVLDAVYAAYTAGWDDDPGGPEAGRGLAGEAVWLARVLARLLPDEPEVLGLLALLLHCEARRAARRDAAGRYVPLPEQDTGRWDGALMAEAETLLRRAAARNLPGRFQLEAAIQSVHAQRACTGGTGWAAVAALYDALVRLTPALGARIGRAVAHARANGPAAGLALLDDLPAGRLAAHPPWWAARAQLLAEAGRSAEARAAYTRAIGLSELPATREFLAARKAALGG
jgi:RNA polymerase sigma-70 factor (ECF subfamily)